MGLLRDMIRPFQIKILLFIVIFSFLTTISCSKKIQIQKFLDNENEWQIFGSDSTRNFHIKSNLPLPLKLKWQLELDAGLNNSSVTSLSKFLCVADLKGNVYFIDNESGRVHSKISLKQPVLTSVALRERDLIVPLASTKHRASQIILYDLLIGNIKKTFESNGSIEREMVFTQNSIFATTTNGYIYCLKYDLNKLWELKLNEEINCTPAFTNGIFVVASLNGNLILIDSNGKILKKVKVNSGVYSGISVRDSMIYFGDIKGNLYCYSLSGVEIWKKNLKASIKAIPSIDEFNVYLGDLSGNVYSLDRFSGEINWVMSQGGMINNSILVLNEHLIVPDAKGFIYVLKKSNGEVIQSIELKGRVKFSPVYLNGMLFIGHNDKKISAYESH